MSDTTKDITYQTELTKVKLSVDQKKFLEYDVLSETGDSEGCYRNKIRIALLEARIAALEKTVEGLK